MLFWKEGEVADEGGGLSFSPSFWEHLEEEGFLITARQGRN
jgi:hypothetical protein